MPESTGQLKQQYDDFLRAERYNLHERITTVLDDHQHLVRNTAGDVGGPRVTFNLAELRCGEGKLSNRLRRDPLRHLRAIELACHDIASESRPGYEKNCGRIRVGISGPLGQHPLSPRHLNSSLLRQLVCVEGVCTRVSGIKSKIVESVHYCPATKLHVTQEFVDATDPNLGLPKLDAEGKEIPDRIMNVTSSIYPTKDKNGNNVEMEFGLSTFKDHQTITLQEMPEKAPMGQLPRSVELILDNDLVDKLKPGDRVMVVGVFRALATASQGQKTSSGMFRTCILANHIQKLGQDISHLKFTVADIRSIKALAKRSDVLSVLGRSVAPSIHGHQVIKEALILQLLSGMEKNLKNGTHLRGDINILMVGDPSTAKSQLLRAAMYVAPLAISTTGKGSTGVGLTAAVTSDPDTKERRLEAGAMVLGDRGLVCVDEFDKMGEGDRVSIHEAMEQQTVTIAKAGIRASLNARCSVLGAANPVYGHYDQRKKIQENIGLPDSLLSRFDLLFVVLDKLDAVSDRRIAEHVVRGHMSRTEEEGYINAVDSDDDTFHTFEHSRVHSIWQSKDRINSRNDVTDDEDADKSSRSGRHGILQHDFLRKYLHFAKTTIKPVLTDGARELISFRYAEMRARQSDRTLPVTARTLETLIRLSTAHAKARLSSFVEAKPDCEIAISILSHALYFETSNMSLESIDTNIHRQQVKSTLTDATEASESASDGTIASSKKSKRLRSVEQDLMNSMGEYFEGNPSFSMNNFPECMKKIADSTTIVNLITRLASENKLFVSDDAVYRM